MTELLRGEPPLLHGTGGDYFGLAWPALAWLEQNVSPGMTTLETGSGASSIVFAARGARHVSISPPAREHERIVEFCASQGIDTSDLTFIAESSDTALTDTWEPEPLDLVLADGAHLFPFPALDWFLTSRHLKVGGRIVLDDAYLPSVAMVVKFLRSSESWRFDGAISYRTVVFTKLDEGVGYDAIGSAFDRFPRFGYLPLPQRVVALARYFLLDRWNVVGRLRKLR